MAKSEGNIVSISYEKKTREEYALMLETGEYDLREDQIAIIAAASLTCATFRNSDPWASILISLGLLQSHPNNVRFLISTAKGDEILESYTKIEIYCMLRDYRASNGLDYFNHASIFMIPLIPIEHLPEILVGKNRGARTAAAKQIFWHQHGRFPDDNLVGDGEC